MPIQAKVIDSKFNVLDEAEIPDALVRLLLSEESPVAQLRYIDEYGDTYFNSLQVRDAIPELKLLHAEIRNSDLTDSLSRLLRLAQLATEQPHRFLAFEGD